jgi:serine/threonine-protein kinase
MKIEPESWPLLSQLLDQLLDLPPESRSGWLENLGPEHAAVLPMLRRAIATQASAESEGFLNTLPSMGASASRGVAGSAPLVAAFTAGTLIGPYRLVSELGQGGMGVVWLAERADGEMRRPVALKLPILALHNRMLAERFTRERDILAQLTHPCIARLYDAGVTDRGQPYLAMEYVEGEKITASCDRRRVGLKGRLQLFLQVLRAVQYAHNNLIVHRDLKPANILVTDEGDARLLDFGIAKLLTEGEANETELTRMGGRALTPDYASPEQITGKAVSTASDVYSLGVLLYELLTGGRPYRLKRDTPSGLEEAILGAEPARPSQAAIDGTRAQARGVTPRRLARSLKGDLDTIVLKALSKQPSQRYVSPDAFAQDIERYLGGEAVLAQPESIWYRARKFVLRNKLVVGGVAAIVAALSAGLGIALWQAHVARTEIRTAESVETFLLDIFRANSSAHPDPVRARQTTARELLDDGARKMDAALGDAPEAKLRVLETLFKLYTDLGLPDQAAGLARKRIALARSVYGPDHPEVARALVDLVRNSAAASFVNDRPALLKEAERILDRNRDFTSRTRAGYDLAVAAISIQTNLAKSADFASRAIKLYREYPPSDELATALNLLGQVEVDRTHFREGILALSEAAGIIKSLRGESRHSLPAIYAYLAENQFYLLDMPAAEQNYRLALDTARSLKGEEHVDVIQTKYRLGSFLVLTSRPQEGLKLGKEAVELALRTQAPGELFHTPMVREGYGSGLLRYDRLEEGLVPISQAVDTARRGKRDRTRDFADSLERIAYAETELGHYRQATAALEECFAIHAAVGDTPPSVRLENALVTQIRLLIATGRATEAETVLRNFPAETNPNSPLSFRRLDFSLATGAVALAVGRYEDAIRSARELRTRLEASSQRLYFKRFEAPAALQEGKGLLLTHHPAEALPLLQRAVQLGSEVYDPHQSPALADSKIALAKCLLTLGRRDQTRALLAQAKAIHSTHKDLGEQFRRPLRELEALLATRD